MKLPLMSLGVTTNGCLWEFYKTHTTDLKAQPYNISLPGKAAQGSTRRSTKLKRTGACSVFDVHGLNLRRNDGLQAISTPPPTSAAFQNFYLEEDYPSIIGFDGECMDIPLQPAPGDWSKCPTLLGVLDYSPAIPMGQAGPLHIEERLVGVKDGGLI